MYTQCPQCLTIFAIEEDALQASLGIVHCGRCGQRFDALRTLSNSLPAEHDTPLAERDAGERVPILTQAVPPPAQTGHPYSEAAASATTPEPEGDGSSAPPGADDAVPAAPDLPDADTGTDWFADFENELTTSLLSDATRAFPDDVAGYAWQVDELPAQASFAVPDISTIFWGSAADLDAFEAMTAEDSTHAAGASGDPDAPEAPATAAPAFPAVPPDELAEIAREDFDPMPVEGFAHASNPAAAQPTHESAAKVFESAGADPAQAKAAPAGLSATPGANQLLAHDAMETDVVETDGAETDVAETADIVPAHAETTATEVVSDPTESLAPVYVRPRARRTVAVAWVLGCLVLALVLAAQLAWIKRVDLLRDPATHAWMVRACQVIECGLPPIRDVAKLELVSRDVRPDAGAPGALMITATVRNDAGFRQPWPVVVVELTDLDNNVVAMRRFRPAEYMPDAARRAAGIAAGATSAVAFEVADPGKRAVAFQFSFE